MAVRYIGSAQMILSLLLKNQEPLGLGLLDRDFAAFALLAELSAAACTGSSDTARSAGFVASRREWSVAAPAVYDMLLGVALRLL
jgi:hypothetical protein